MATNCENDSDGDGGRIQTFEIDAAGTCAKEHGSISISINHYQHHQHYHHHRRRRRRHHHHHHQILARAAGHSEY